MDPDDVRMNCDAILDEIERAVVSDRNVLETILVGLLADGHVLLEDVPGTGKTLTARSVADTLGLSFSRIQFTPDLLPSDVIGANVFDEGVGEFEFQPGPVFGNIVLADEINRAPPKTQSALLEAMGEGQITVDGDTHSLPEPFVVIATQNPIEMDGTFELPAAQKDRFIIKTSIGYPDLEGELQLIDRRANRQTQAPTVEQVCTPETVNLLRAAPEHVDVEAKVRRYLVEVARETRRDRRVSAGVSPRGVQRLFEAVRTRAVVEGRSYATPDDVKAMAPNVLPHRLVLSTDAHVDRIDPGEIIDGILDTVEVPKIE